VNATERLYHRCKIICENAKPYLVEVGWGPASDASLGSDPSWEIATVAEAFGPLGLNRPMPSELRADVENVIDDLYPPNRQRIRDALAAIPVV